MAVQRREESKLDQLLRLTPQAKRLCAIHTDIQAKVGSSAVESKLIGASLCDLDNVNDLA